MSGIVLSFVALAGAQVPAKPTQSAPPPLVDINTASAGQLATLPGMGAAYAERVVRGRPYSAKNQLVTRGILPEAAYERISGRIIAKHPQ